MEILRLITLVIAALSASATGRFMEDDDSLSRLEALLADYKREKQENDAASSLDVGSLLPAMRDEHKPRMHSKLEMTSVETKDDSTLGRSRHSSGFPLTKEKKDVIDLEDFPEPFSDAKEKKEAENKKIANFAGLENLRDEIKPRMASKPKLESPVARDAKLHDKRTSLLDEQAMKRSPSRLRELAKKKSEPGKEETKMEDKKAPKKEKKLGLVVDYKPFESAEQLEEKAEKVMAFLKNHPCPTPEESFYNITVKTANKTLAGTTSKVYIDLYGSLYNQRQSTGKFRLTSGNENIAIEFGKARVDSFVVKASFVGIVNRITIEHDNSGLFPDWSLDKIIINDLKLGTTHTFPCNCELSGYDNTMVLPPV